MITAIQATASAQPRSLAELLPFAAARAPQKTALVCGDRTLSYGELDDLTNRLAQALVAQGLGAGECVSLLAQNRWEWVVAYHAVLKAGAVVNPLNAMLTDDEVSYVLADCGARFVFTTSSRAAAVQELAAGIPSLDHVISFDDPPPGVLGLVPSGQSLG